MSAITITGRLLRDAAARTSARTDEWTLDLQLAPPAGPKGKPHAYHATMHFGTGAAAAMACKRRAQQLREGVRVTVSAAGADVGRGHSVLAPLDWLDTPDLRPVARFADA
jgi:hypothetical protein